MQAGHGCPVRDTRLDSVQLTFGTGKPCAMLSPAELFLPPLAAQHPLDRLRGNADAARAGAFLLLVNRAACTA